MSVAFWGQGWLGGVVMLCNFQCQGMLLMRIIVGQRVVVLAAGVCVCGGGDWC